MTKPPFTMFSRAIFFLISVIAIGWLESAQFAFAAVSIVLPNGGECLTVGQSYTIQITASEDHTALYYRTDGGQPTHLDSSEIKHPLIQTSWNWTPASADISETGRIWVEGHNNNHNSAGTWDSSDANFSIRTSCSATPPPSPPPPSPSPSPTPAAGGGESFAQQAPIIKSLTAREITASSAVVSWQTDRSTYYKFSYGKTSGDYTSVTSTGLPYSDRSDHIVALSNLEEDTTYYFQIIAGLGLPNPTVSQEYNFKTLDLKPPGQVRNVFGVAGASTTLISWINPSDSDFKETMIVRRDDRFAENRSEGAIVFTGGEIYYTDSGRENSISYYYSIFTTDSSENSSEPVNILLTPQYDLPAAPIPPQLSSSTASTTLRVGSLSSESGDSTIRLAWSNPKNENFLGVQIARNEESLPANAYDGDVIFRGRTESFEDRGLLPQKRYNYGVFPFDWENDFYSGSFISNIPEYPEETIQELQLQIDEARKLLEKLTLMIKANILSKLTAESPEEQMAAPSTNSLSIGSRGEAVREVQELLAKDPEIYPEGLVTGYFGPLTRAAIQRFQEKYNIVSSGDESTTGYGSVGPTTIEKLRLVLGGTRYEVVIGVDDSLSPRSIAVPQGAEVNWINKSVDLVWIASDRHPAHEIYPEFDALRGIPPGETYSFIFDRVGRWSYHDHLRADIRIGEVIVR